MNTDFRVAVDFFDHPKTLRLLREHGPHGVLSLLRLWAWAARHRPKGDLSGVPDADLEVACQWTGSDGKFLETLRALGFVDASKLHDWRAHQAYAYHAPERVQNARKAGRASAKARRNKSVSAKNAASTDGQRVVDESFERNGNASLPIRTNSKPQSPDSGLQSPDSDSPSPCSPPAGDVAFARFWTAYPRKVGKGAAVRAWKRHKPPLPDVLSALAWQVQTEQWTSGIVPNPATWINGHRWTDEPSKPVGDAKRKHEDAEFNRALKLLRDQR